MTDDLDTQWRPLSVRESGAHAAYDSLHPGVPPWLRDSLWGWITGRIGGRNNELLRIERVFRIEYDPRGSAELMLIALKNRAFAKPEFFLDVVDLLLSTLDVRKLPSNHPQYQNHVADSTDLILLVGMLRDAGSLWQVGATGERFQLERRVALDVEAAARQVMNVGDKAAQHLRLAWNAIYGRQPDPSKGYREAIRAVEVATIPVVLPTDPSATLGKVVAALRAKPAKWSLGLKHSDPERQVLVVADMLDLVWKGQSDRHGDPDPSAPLSVTLEQAQAAVHLSMTVVQWFSAGVLAVR